MTTKKYIIQHILEWMDLNEFMLMRMTLDELQELDIEASNIESIKTLGNMDLMWDEDGSLISIDE